MDLENGLKLNGISIPKFTSCLNYFFAFLQVKIREKRYLIISKKRSLALFKKKKNEEKQQF